MSRPYKYPWVAKWKDIPRSHQFDQARCGHLKLHVGSKISYVMRG